jgi:flagellar motor switch protein FliG
MTESKSKKNNFDGLGSAAEMLNVMDKSDRERILSQLSQRDPSIAEKIREKMFLFEDLCHLDAKSMGIFVGKAPRRKLVLALRGVEVDFIKVFFSNLPLRAAQTLKEEIEAQGPQKLSDVTKAQRELVEIAKNLLNTGEISFER